MTPAAHPSAEPPIRPDQLPVYDQIVLDALAVEHRKSVDAMGRTLLNAGWRPEQVAHVVEHWSWTQIARAVGAVRARRGEPVVAASALDEVQGAQPSAVQARAEAAWAAEYGPTPPPRPPGRAPIQLPARPRPATTPDVGAYAPGPALESESQAERQ